MIGSAEVIRRILVCRGLRALGDGLVAILLPIRLEQLGYGPVGIGAIATSALLGSALLTILLGFMGHRLRLRRMLLGASLLMAGTGLAFAYLESFWLLMLAAFIGTLNPSGGDVSVFLPLEHTLVAQSAPDEARTAIYARYSFIGSIGAALGSLAAGALDWTRGILPPRIALDGVFPISCSSRHRRNRACTLRLILARTAPVWFSPVGPHGAALLTVRGGALAQCRQDHAHVRSRC